MNEHEALVDQAVRTKHTVLLIGGMDTGKTTLSRELLAAALAAGRPAALLDADVGQKTVGPPATISLKIVRGPEDLEPEPIATPPPVEWPDALLGEIRIRALGFHEPVVVDRSGEAERDPAGDLAGELRA